MINLEYGSFRGEYIGVRHDSSQRLTRQCRKPFLTYSIVVHVCLYFVVFFSIILLTWCAYEAYPRWLKVVPDAHAVRHIRDGAIADLTRLGLIDWLSTMLYIVSSEHLIVSSTLVSWQVCRSAIELDSPSQAAHVARLVHLRRRSLRVRYPK